jgi:hypothetical protein
VIQPEFGAARRVAAATCAGLALLCGCSDQVPTSTDGDDVPVEAVTVELRLPFAEFVSDFQLYDGFGSTSVLSALVVAHDWEGDVEARSLFRFVALPRAVFVFPPGQNVSVRDSILTPVSGSLALEMDTLEARGPAPYRLQAAVIETAWHAPSASWALAVDTLGAQIPWPVPGAGPVERTGEAEWDPFAHPPDSAQVTEVVIPLDSASIAALVDTIDVHHGLRVSSLDPDTRLRIRSAELRVVVRPSIHPDTLVNLALAVSQIAYIQDPPPTLDPASFPIGGAPAVRAVFHLDLPESVSGTPEVCALVTCPIELLPERLVYAGLELHTAPPTPIGLRPVQETVIELRPVLSAERLPRSPLGFPLACPTGDCSMTLPSTTVSEEDFTVELGTRVDMPMTRYVRDLLREEGTLQAPVPRTIALMNGLDPVSNLELRPLEYSTFWGAGTELEPMLRLILTVSDGVPPP